MTKPAVPFVVLTRGPLAECVHRGHLAATDADGCVVASAGDPAFVTFARSAAKLLQAVAVVASGAAERFALTDDEIALLCASHSGEEAHVATARRILDKIGADASQLRCGAHAPYHKPSAAALKRAGAEPEPLHNNCSGKHAGMLAFAKQLNAALDDYPRPEHPVQRAMLAAFAALAGVRVEDVALGTDGCGVPVYGVPLAALATAYAKLGEPDRAGELADACRTVVRAVASHPDMIAGTDRFDTALVRATGGRLIGKMGAEGVFAVANADAGLGLALKIEDGAQRALYPAVTEALVQLGWIDEPALSELAAFRAPPIRNWSGDEVGRTVPVLKLERAE